MKKIIGVIMVCFMMVLCTACSNDEGAKDETFSRNFENDFEGKYWISEDNDGFYFNGQQYLFLEDGELSTGAYVVIKNKIVTTMDRYSYSEKEWKTPADGYIGDSLYEMSEDSLVLYFDLDDGGNATTDGIVYTETTKEKFEELSNISIEFSSISSNTYWQKKTKHATDMYEILYYDDNSFIKYMGPSAWEQKYSADSNTIFLDSTITFVGADGTMQHKGGLEQKYSIINDIMVINIDATNGELITTTDLIMYTLIDKGTAKEIIDNK